MKGKFSCKGYTLVELIVGMLVFGLMAAGIASSSLVSSRMAVSNIYANTAFAVAQSYGEQIKSLSQSVVRRALDDPDNNTLPTASLSMGMGSVTQMADPLTFGVRTQKDIVVDVEKLPDGSLRERIMRMWITPTGNDLLKSSIDLDAIEITINYEWKVPGGRRDTTFSRSLKIVKTNVLEH